MADFNYLHTNCFEVTVEVGCEKFPLEEELFTIWHENRDALLSYMEMVQLCFYRLSCLLLLFFIFVNIHFFTLSLISYQESTYLTPRSAGVPGVSVCLAVHADVILPVILQEECRLRSLKGLKTV